MNNITKNNEIEQPQNEGEPTLCKNCFEFFGDQRNEHLCSKCYREKHTPLPKEEASFSNPSIEEEIKINEPEKKILIEDISNNKQIDIKKCWKCQRKAGLLGYQCKCLYTFCKLHRLPEYHECTYDFASEGKKKLMESNPVVKGSKLEKI